MPRSVGRCRRSSWSAFRPPAEAPIPTIGNDCLKGGVAENCRSDATPGSGSTGAFLRPVNRYDLRLDVHHEGRNEVGPRALPSSTTPGYSLHGNVPDQVRIDEYSMQMNIVYGRALPAGRRLARLELRWRRRT